MGEIKEGYTRISAISSAFAGYGKIPSYVLDKAACRGDRVHKIIYDYINDISIPEDRFEFMGDRLEGYFESFKKFWTPYETNTIVLQEQRINDDIEMLTGEPDLVIKDEGGLTLIDWKATLSIGNHWRIQAEGYSYLLSKVNSMCIDKILFVKLDKAGGVPVVTEYEPTWDVFEKAYDLYKMFLEKQECNLERE